MAARLVVEEITDTVGLEALAPEWADLLSRCPDAAPFQSPDWLLPWWRYLGSGRLRCLALRQEGRLTGFAPLYVRPGALRRLVFLGTGNSDVLDLLLEPGCAEAGTLLEALLNGPAPWECIDLHALRFGSRAFAWRSWGRTINQEMCPVLTLPNSTSELPACLSAGLRAHLQYARRRLAREAVSIEAATPETLPEHLEALFRLHSARWHSRGLPGVFFHPAVRGFHHEASWRFLTAARLRLYGLRWEGTLRASLYAFAGHRRTYYYAGGFDPALAAWSPGTLLIAHAIEEAIREGHTEFDFLRGDERYKYRWGAADRPNFRLVLPGRGAGSLAPVLAEAEERLKSLGLRVVRAWGSAYPLRR